MSYGELNRIYFAERLTRLVRGWFKADSRVDWSEQNADAYPLVIEAMKLYGDRQY